MVQGAGECIWCMCCVGVFVHTYNVRKLYFCKQQKQNTDSKKHDHSSIWQFIFTSISRTQAYHTMTPSHNHTHHRHKPNINLHSHNHSLQHNNPYKHNNTTHHSLQHNTTPTGVAPSMFAPFLSSTSTTPTWPFWDDMSKGVKPFCIITMCQEVGGLCVEWVSGRKERRRGSVTCHMCVVCKGNKKRMLLLCGRHEKTNMLL